MNRAQFNLGLSAALVGLGSVSSALAQSTDTSKPAQSQATTPSGAHQHNYFFKDSSFEFVFLSVLGRAFHQGGNVGKALYVMRQIEDGNSDSAVAAYVAAGDEMLAIAENSANGKHRESARQAYLWAQNFYDAAMYFCDGSSNPEQIEPIWEKLDAAWRAAMPFFDPPIEEVQIPYEGTTLRGFYFRGNSTAEKRPLLILVNGSDGSLLDMWMMGGAGGTARGYDCLTFDGPGQGYALWKQGLHFRPDWEKVITPVVDYVLTRPDVDPKRIALQGISQGGYWVPRALAFEKRIAAGIADPAVMNVSTSWTATLPPPLLAMLKNGQKQQFDAYLNQGMPASAKADLAFRMRPFGFTSYYDTFKATMDYNLDGVIDQITAPMLITAPANEGFWPGQSQQMFDALKGKKTLVPFTEADGADLHCEPKGYGLRDLRIFDWLDGQIGGA